jgi:signal peptidase II
MTGLSAGGAADDHAGTLVLTHFPSYLRFLGVAVFGLVLDLWSKYWAFSALGQGHRPCVVIPHVLEFQTMLNSGALFGIGGGQTLLFLLASVCALLLVFWMFVQTSPRRWVLQIALGGILAGALGNMYDRVFVKLLDQPLPSGGRYVYAVQTGEDEHGLILQEYPPSGRRAEFRLRASSKSDGGVTVTLYPSGITHYLKATPASVGFVRDFIKIPTTMPDWSWLPARIRGREAWPWVFNVADMLLVGGVGILAIHLWRDRKHTRQQERNPVDSRGSPA